MHDSACVELMDAVLNSQVTGLIAAIVLAGLVALWLLVRAVRRARRPRRPPPSDLTLDVSQLPATGPPSGPRLEFYGTPVRLAVVVVAPAGRDGQLPPADVMPGLMERLVPGLPQVIADHQPLIRRWPAQLSSEGFVHAFFHHVALPGDRGRGTPWCAIAGKFQVGERGFLAGFVCCAARPNSLGQVTVRHEGQWLDILRFRDQS